MFHEIIFNGNNLIEFYPILIPEGLYRLKIEFDDCFFIIELLYKKNVNANDPYHLFFYDRLQIDDNNFFYYKFSKPSNYRCEIQNNNNKYFIFRVKKDTKMVYCFKIKIKK